MLVSIVIPSYNKGVLIKETLNSVLCQSYTNWECLIIDDGSNQETLNYIFDFLNIDHRFILIERKKNNYKKGVSSCRNLGVKSAKGEFLIFLDSDDLLKQDCLFNRIEFFNSYKNNDFIIFKMAEFSKMKPAINIIESKDILKEDVVEDLKSFLKLKGNWQVTSPMYRTEFLKSFKGFNERLEVYEDLEFAARAILKANKYAVTSVIDSLYRVDTEHVEKRKTIVYITKCIDNFLIYSEAFNKEIKDLLQTQQKYKVLDTTSYFKDIYISFLKRDITTYPELKEKNKLLLKTLYNLKLIDYKYYFLTTVSSYLLNIAFRFKGFGLFRFIYFLSK